MSNKIRNLRKTQKWKSLRIRLWLEREHYCYICGYEIPEVDSLNPLSYELDHILSAHDNPELFYDEENLALTHQICNKKKNNRKLTVELSEQCQTAVSKILKEQTMQSINSEDSMYSGIVGSYDFF